ncbi:MAG: PocR ligand-binding domain-containing protein [Limnochordia bacterium]|jgi:two-component system response regulator YesN
MTMLSNPLSKVADTDELQRLLDGYALIHGVPAAVFDERGEVWCSSSQPQARLCKLVQETAHGRRACRSCRMYAGNQAMIIGEGYIHRCPAGLVVWASPLVSAGEYVGGIIAGQVLMWEIDEMVRIEISQLAKACGIPPQVLLDAAERLPVIGPQAVQAASDLLFVLAAYISNHERLSLLQQRRISNQQARLAESIIEKKQALEEQAAGTGSSLYPLDKERQLLGRVRVGDRTGAKEILNQMLGDILFNSAGKPEVLKARLLELSVVLSRAAVEGGGSLERLLGLNFAYVEELAALEPIEEICAWIVKVLDAFMDEVYAAAESRDLPVIRQAVSYIKEHFREELTLEDVAQEVHFSPFYVSRLFKEELGLTFIEYLTKIRIDEAKRLLLETNKTVSEIADLVGYQDPSYFTKVFKKREGVTPTQFRR